MLLRDVAHCLVPVLAVAAFAGCTSGNSAIEPPFQSANISTLGKLQFAVGTANIAYPAGTQFIGLNTVETFRQPSGASAFGVTSPQIIGPPRFVIPASTAAGNDARTNTMNSTAQGGTANTTFGMSGDATLYGFGPNNYDSSGTPNFGNYALPFYTDKLGDGMYPTFTFYGLPPAFPSPPADTGFKGYNPGFVDFAAAAVSGTYKLNVTIPTSAGSSQGPFSYAASATLNAGKVLPPFAQPIFSPAATGPGGTVAVTFPVGVMQALVEVNDTTSATSESLLFSTSGSQSDTIIARGDSYQIIAAGFDYNAFAPAAPANQSQTPAILGPNGQDDVTVSAPFGGIAPASARRETQFGSKPRN